MSEVYIIRNQDHLYLDKQGEWVDGSDSQSLYRTSYKDEALNLKVELSVRYPQLRLTLVSGALDERGHLVLQRPDLVSQRPDISGPAIDPGHSGLFRSAEDRSEESAADHTDEVTHDLQQTADSDV